MHHRVNLHSIFINTIRCTRRVPLPYPWWWHTVVITPVVSYHTVMVTYSSGRPTVSCYHTLNGDTIVVTSIVFCYHTLYIYIVGKSLLYFPVVFHHTRMAYLTRGEKMESSLSWSLGRWRDAGATVLYKTLNPCGSLKDLLKFDQTRECLVQPTSNSQLQCPLL